MIAVELLGLKGFFCLFGINREMRDQMQMFLDSKLVGFTWSPKRKLQGLPLPDGVGVITTFGPQYHL